jgi:hypothetical protein
MTVSMVSPFAMMTKRCAERNARRNASQKEAGKMKLVNQEPRGVFVTFARGAPKMGVPSRTRPRLETKSA